MLFLTRMGWGALTAGCLFALIGNASAQAPPLRTPITGTQPLVGIGLTDEFKDENSGTFFIADNSSFPGGSWLGTGGQPFFDVALLDTGAGATLITAAADAQFDLEGNGFDGTVLQKLGGATGFLFATVDDPLGIYATGLGNRTGVNPLALNTSTMKGQTSVSLLTLPAESDLPNVLGLTFASQFKTTIHADQPQIFPLDGSTVRTPNITFGALGTGGDGILRRAPITLNPSSSFLTPPLYVFNFENILSNEPLTENPSNPTNIQGGLFLTVSVRNEGMAVNDTPFFFDTGADVTVVSELNAVRLGFDLDEPDFTIPVLGSAGTLQAVPGFFAEELTVATVGGASEATNVPIIALDVTDPSQIGNIVPGIIGTNVFTGRNLVIDPNPAVGGGGAGPSVYISDPVTRTHTWSSPASSASWNTPSNWDPTTTPDVLTVARVHPVGSGPQEAVVATDATIWELNVSGTTEQMTVRIDQGAQLTTFSGVNIETGGRLHLSGGTLDAHYVELFGGTLSGSGTVQVGNGPIPGQVESRGGTVAPGDGIGTLTINGLFSNGVESTLSFQLGGTAAGSDYDQLVVSGDTTLDGTLEVVLTNAFQPTLGDQFSLLIAGALGGEFSRLQLPSDFDWNVNYALDRVVLSVAGVKLRGDLSGDGSVDVLDAAIMFSEWGVGTSSADLDHNGFIDAGDAGILFANWTGDAANARAAAVPEPIETAPLWAGIFIACLLAGRRGTPTAPIL